MSSSKTVAILSGGLDSTTMLYDLRNQKYDVVAAVSFNYGQRHKKELEFAKATCDKLGVKHIIIDLGAAGFREAIEASGSSLVSDNDVPEGHYAEENMKQTVVPNRNMVMISIAISIAVAEDATFVATGVHAGDHAIYPDCRPEFIRAVSEAGRLANVGFGSFQAVVTPYIYSSKAHIALQALQLGLPVDQTWSCYKGGDKHCGKCGTCVERLEALHEAVDKMNEYSRQAGHEELEYEKWDKTEYEDSEFWKGVVEANA